jgi:hypothetical protein
MSRGQRRLRTLGLGGRPVVQPTGTVIVPFKSLRGTIGASAPRTAA